jgi:hypothetical protein
MSTTKEDAGYPLYTVIILFIIALVGYFWFATDTSISLQKIQIGYCLSMIPIAMILCVAILVYLVFGKMEDDRYFHEYQYRRLEERLDALGENTPDKHVLAEEIHSNEKVPLRVTRVICPNCRETEDITDPKRPLEMKCRKCGTRLMVRK